MFVATFILSNTSCFGFSNTTFRTKKEFKTITYYTFPDNLTNFDYNVSHGPSTNQTITIEDNLGLDRSYTVTAPTGYEVSTTPAAGFNTSITIAGSTIDAGSVTVYIRLGSGLPINIYSGNLSISAPDATVDTVYYPPVNEQITLSGEVSRKTTSWNGSTWSNDPPSIADIAIITSDYTTLLHGSFSAWSLDIASGQQLIIDDYTFVEIENNVVVNGTLAVASSGAFVQNDDSASFTVSTGGEAYVSKTTSILNKWYDYTYWSSPVNGATAEEAFSFSHPNYRFWFNAQNYLDILEEIGNTNTYVTGHDDIDDDGNDWTLLGNTNVLEPGVGYATTHNSVGFLPGNSYSYVFSGPFNTGIITTPIYYNGDNGDNDWNFIGNPYPSAISVDDFFTQNNTMIGDAVYLWSHATPISNTNSGNQGQNFSANDYAIINAGSGEVAGSSGVIPNRYIPSGQGFFVQGKANGNVTFNNAMRMKDNTSNSQFFRQNTNTMANKLWLNLTSDNGVFNQVLIAYVDGATDGDDGSAYDSTRFLSSGAAAIIYTMIENELDKKYAIQGKSTSSINTQEVIPLGFYTSISDPTIYTFSIPKKQGAFINNQPIFIKDNLLNITHNIVESDYNFTSTTGDFTNRFEIVFNAETLSTNINLDEDYGLSITTLNTTTVKFNVNDDSSIENIKLYSTEGKLIYNNTIHSQSSTINLQNCSSGIYLAMVELDNNAIVKRKLIL